MRVGLLIVVMTALAGAFAPDVSAQAPPAVAAAAVDPIIAHFRAYRAAREAGDLATAETEAAAALAASEADNGDGGATPVLAMNLALTRVDRERYAEAVAPAQRAQALAAAAATQALDPLLVQLVLGQALLGSHDRRGEAMLVAALAAGQTRADLQGRLYDAALLLGTSAYADGDWATARDAFVEADRHAAGAPVEEEFARAQAQIWRAGALVLMGKEPEALSILTAARERLKPFAFQIRDDGELTYAQQAYALATAWRAVAYTRLRRGERRAEDGSRQESEDQDEPTPLTSEFGPRCCCPFEVIGEPPPRYPPNALERYGVGSVVVRVRFREDGEIIDRDIAAAIPSQSFPQTVAAVFDRWQMIRAPDAPPDCTFPPIQFVTVAFRIGQ